jgi:lysosomal acid phosphatase
MRQLYNLGARLKAEYIDELGFLKSRFNHTEVNIRSTDLNRTLMSV